MNEFISRYAQQITGTLAGFDRLVFRGNLSLIHEAGMKGYLFASKVPWKDYAAHVTQVSQRIKEASLEAMTSQGRRVQYLNSGKISKEALARSIALEQGITSGSVCAFTAVEPCLTWRVAGDRQAQKLRLIRTQRQCLHIYHYWIDQTFGFMSARLQTWFPFAVYIYMNGREWLSRQMDQAHIPYRRIDNCFTWIEDFPRAQELMAEQLKTDWKSALDACALRINPMFPDLFAHYSMDYYWSAFQSEWAMDIVFRDAGQLERLYPQLIHLGMVTLSSPDVMRFMDKKVTRNGKPAGRSHEVITDVKTRSEGVRIKHRLGKNSIKLYDKAYAESGAVLRSELTINAPGQFRVFRHKAGQQEGPMQWRSMRTSIADLHRRAEVSQNALDRYCTALAAVDDTTTLRILLAAIEKPVRYNGRSLRALHPFQADDLKLLESVNRGEFAINGLRNRDLQALLFPTAPPTAAEARRRSAAISRKLRLLRAHGILHKLPHTHRYQISDHGRLILNAVLSAQRLTTQQLTKLAA